MKQVLNLVSREAAREIGRLRSQNKTLKRLLAVVCAALAVAVLWALPR